MKIISPFTDYYDYISSIYGEDTMDLTYVRSPFAENETYLHYNHKNITVKFDNHIKFPDQNRDYLAEMSTSYKKYMNKYVFKFDWLICAGELYLLYNKTERTSLYTEIPEEKKILTKEAYDEFREYKAFGFHRYKYENYIGVKSDFAVNLSKKVNSPVFVYVGYDTGEAYIKRKIPVLKNIGMSSFVKPEIMYQNIDQFISNVLRNNPDVNPPVELSNVDKIVKHGFDTKTSFRKM